MESSKEYKNMAHNWTIYPRVSFSFMSGIDFKPITMFIYTSYPVEDGFIDFKTEYEVEPVLRTEYNVVQAINKLHTTIEEYESQQKL